MTVTLADLRAEAMDRLSGVAEGDGLSPADSALIRLGLALSPTCLHQPAIAAAAADALALGVKGPTLHEVAVLVSALGVHSLMTASAPLAALREAAGDPVLSAPDTPEQAALRDCRIGGDRYWRRFESRVPGFLDALLRQSPAAFDGFFDYCALPWKDRTMGAVQMELISLAVDACPTHRFRPGFRLHLDNALRLGVGRKAILATLELAAAAPLHEGVG
ncbi:hypothetical protein [Gemmobacter sp.]|uniref:hypothetical protein n=1 Tax=Gemmobacter sp. TaxID=1898957 RepID=UPI002AFFD3EA|nr:hypothetical protein [Gemmobacter sp.]